ncbi:MAG: hypothetical protein EZS28_008636 [Streblomastix strix]|uniref:Uncharacterized protein n=1 Tax=Streblomastix strix TaxID=222440 RepID=A0A5J4WMH8_9EUKA|nr:MAG: hypothetical protein EZS28_008636 [Streblomastix strix]
MYSANLKRLRQFSIYWNTKHKIAFKENSEVHLSLSKLIQQELEDDVITQVPDSFAKYWNQIFAIQKKKRSWRKILDSRIMNSEQRTEYFMLNGITDIQKIIMLNDQASESRAKEAILHENFRLCRRYSDPELGSHIIAARYSASNEDFMGYWLDNRNQQEQNKPTQIVEFLGQQQSTRTMTMQTTISQQKGVYKHQRHHMELVKRKKHIRT